MAKNGWKVAKLAWNGKKKGWKWQKWQNNGNEGQKLQWGNGNTQRKIQQTVRSDNESLVDECGNKLINVPAADTFWVLLFWGFLGDGISDSDIKTYTWVQNHALSNTVLCSLAEERHGWGRHVWYFQMSVSRSDQCSASSDTDSHPVQPSGPITGLVVCMVSMRSHIFVNLHISFVHLFIGLCRDLTQKLKSGFFSLF